MAQSKRISYSMGPEVQAFLDGMIEKKMFRSYQHGIDFCMSCLAEKKMLIVDDKLMEGFGSKLDEILEVVKRL